MPSKKKKYNARFPPARIKKIMQSDEEVGKVAQAVPVIISRALELFVESLLKKAEVVTQARNAKTLTPSHLKQCIMSEHRFDFLRDLVSSISDVQGDEDAPESLTPRPTPTSDQQFIYQSQASQSQGPSTSSISSGNTSSGASTATAVVADGQQQQFPPEISEFMMSLPSQQQQQHLQQHYIKQEDIKTKPEQMYMPISISAPNSSISNSAPNSTPSASSTLAMTSGHHYPIIHPHGVLHNPYIPAANSSADSSQATATPPHHQHLQHPHPLHSHPHPHEQPQHHFYYSQYDNSNGKVKMEDGRSDARLYSHPHSDHVGVGEHPGYEFSREHTHHY